MKALGMCELRQDAANVDVSILCLTYNHGKYIREALDGFLSQETEYTYEILIHDDASSDETVSIIQEYVERYPSKIKPVYQRENQYSKGVLGGITYKFQYPRARGRYLAFCEGDDFWSDPKKLKLQIEFLEKNLDYALSYHNYDVLEAKVRVLHEGRKGQDMNLIDYANCATGIQTLTVVMRNIFKDLVLPDTILRHVTGSYFWFMLAAEHGSVKYMDESMAVYRVHSEGIWSGKSKAAQGKMALSNKYAMILYFEKNMPVSRILRKAYASSAIYYSFSMLRVFDFDRSIEFLKLSFRFGLLRVHLLSIPVYILKKLSTRK